MGSRLLYKAGLLTAVTSVGAAFAFYEAEVFNTPWFSSLRVVRFGRASYAVSSTVFTHCNHCQNDSTPPSSPPPFSCRHFVLVWITSCH